MAQLVGGHLSNIRAASAKRGDAGGSVGGGTAGDFTAGTHDSVQAFGIRRVDERHRALPQLVGDEERVIGPREHVHDGVANCGDVETASRCHWGHAVFRYLPTSGASCITSCSGIASGLVMSAYLRAEAHSHVRS